MRSEVRQRTELIAFRLGVSVSSLVRSAALDSTYELAKDFCKAMHVAGGDTTP